jgi:hypothetical protein
VTVATVPSGGTETVPSSDTAAESYFAWGCFAKSNSVSHSDWGPATRPVRDPEPVVEAARFCGG